MIQPDGIWKTYNLLNKNSIILDHCDLVVHVEFFLSPKNLVHICWKSLKNTSHDVTADIRWTFKGMMRLHESTTKRLCRLLPSLPPTQRLAQHPCSRLLLGSPARADTVSICVRRTLDATKRELHRRWETRTSTHLNAQKSQAQRRIKSVTSWTNSHTS